MVAGFRLMSNRSTLRALPSSVEDFELDEMFRVMSSNEVRSLGEQM